MKADASPIPGRLLPVARCPDVVWQRIEAQLDAPRPQGKRPPRWRWPAAAWGWSAAVVAMLIVWLLIPTSGPTWEVVRIDGKRETGGHVGPGDWIETNRDTLARISVGEIGTVTVEPGSRLRILVTRPNEHRLELFSGAIEAEIHAPPRLFFVNTPATTAIDLGCAYRMTNDSAGNGLLRVTGGWVELAGSAQADAGAVASLVPAGASCKIREGRGAGTPYFEDASPELREALDAFDQAGEQLPERPNGQLAEILRQARVRDTLTLWHLLSRTRGQDRAQVFDRIVALTPLPAGITRERALALDPKTLTRWREELAWVW